MSEIIKEYDDWYFDNDISTNRKYKIGELSWVIQQTKIEKLESDLAIERKSHTYHCLESQNKNDIIDSLTKGLERVKSAYDKQGNALASIWIDGIIKDALGKDLEASSEENK